MLDLVAALPEFFVIRSRHAGISAAAMCPQEFKKEIGLYRPQIAEAAQTGCAARPTMGTCIILLPMDTHLGNQGCHVSDACISEGSPCVM